MSRLRRFVRNIFKTKRQKADEETQKLSGLITKASRMNLRAESERYKREKENKKN